MQQKRPPGLLTSVRTCAQTSAKGLYLLLQPCCCRTKVAILCPEIGDWGGVSTAYTDRVSVSSTTDPV
jgi:hypothetical protein